MARPDEKFLEVLQLTAAARVGGAPLRMTVYLIGTGHEEHDLGCLAPTDWSPEARHVVTAGGARGCRRRSV